MNDFIQIVGYFSLVFIVSMGAGWLATSFATKRRAQKLPLPNGSLQIRSDHKVYRSSFLERTDRGWRISAPLARDSYVPLRNGEGISVIAPAEGGVYRFKSSIVERYESDHSFLIAAPSPSHFLNRREESRIRFSSPPEIELEGSQATLLDLSTWGAQIESRQKFGRGERLKLRLPGADADVYAWALEAVQGGSRVRVRFEEALDIGKYKKTAPTA